MLLMYKSHTTDTTSALAILSFLVHGCLAEALHVCFMTLGVGHIIAKYQKYMFVIGEIFSV